jgi:hypothetical protein
MKNSLRSLMPKRSWFQFSLKAMMLGMTLVSVPLAWLAHDHNEFRKREAAIATIQRLGGKVTYETSLSLFGNHGCGPLFARKVTVRSSA